MRKNYNKPLLEIKEYDASIKFASLTVSGSEMTWTPTGTNTEGYKEFEW